MPKQEEPLPESSSGSPPHSRTPPRDCIPVKKFRRSRLNGDPFLSSRTIPGVTSRPRSRSSVLVTVRNSFSSLSNLRTGDNEYDEDDTVGNIGMDIDDDVLSVASHQSALNIPSSARLPKIHKVSMLSDDPKSSDHLVLPYVVNNSIVASSIPDSGATSQFMDYD